MGSGGYMIYESSWAPQDEAQAQFLIDTSREGREFWEAGVATAERLTAYRPKNCQSVLDYGCGIGRVIGNFRPPNCIGVDVSREMLDMARKYFPHVNFLRCDGRSIPVKAGSIDFIYSLLVLQHMDAADVYAVVADVDRVLSPGGRTFLSFSGFGTPWGGNATLPRGPLNWMGQRSGSNSPAHGALAYTEEIVRRLAEDAKLKIIDVEHEIVDSYHHNYNLIATK